MQIEHRRPLIAYLACAVLCAFVLLQSMQGTGSGPGEPAPRLFADGTVTPSAPVADVVDAPKLSRATAEESGPSRPAAPLAPGLAAVEAVTGGPVWATPAPAPESASPPAGTDQGEAADTGDGDAVVLAAELVGGPPGSSSDGPSIQELGSGGGVLGGAGPDLGSSLVGGHDGPAVAPGQNQDGPTQQPTGPAGDAPGEESPNAFTWQDPAELPPPATVQPSPHGSVQAHQGHPYALPPATRDQGRSPVASAEKERQHGSAKDTSNGRSGTKARSGRKGKSEARNKSGAKARSKAAGNGQKS